MSNETTITVRGWAGNDPIIYSNSDSADGNQTRISTVVVNVGVTARIFSRKSGQFEDGNTTWYSVRCYGSLARNVSMCVHRGTPLLVRGRLVTRSYVDKEGVTRTSNIIMADSVGIDLNNGIASFVKSSQAALPQIDGEANKWEVGREQNEADARSILQPVADSEESHDPLSDGDKQDDGGLDPAGLLVGVS
ncbi:single-strand DNA-binding protein [Arcanobacterium pluranimalium]|uniref:single-stranded DNA-binding protein n=1 Tax=Arcanobacterium pluranimalium TaxID=108028 RepID=UPI001957DF5C|nr:single-stranded DNA-binding protein [Arcanobacterium pluranimalium]MBM7825724.1 single-strand DNA-binding protein [Arcanobacterium pluranimalium]